MGIWTTKPKGYVLARRSSATAAWSAALVAPGGGMPGMGGFAVRSMAMVLIPRVLSSWTTSSLAWAMLWAATEARMMSWSVIWT